MTLSQIDPAWLSKFVRGISIATWVVDAEGNMLDVPEWTTLTGQTAADAAGDGWLDAIHPDDAARVDAAWLTAISHQTPYNTEYRLRCADGIYRWVNARGLPVLDAEGNVEKWFGLVMSVAGSARYGRTDTVDRWGIAEKFDDITPPALRAARALLNWPAERLASEAGLSRSTIRRLEDDESVIASRRSSVKKILRVLTREHIRCVARDDTIIGVSLDKAATS